MKYKLIRDLDISVVSDEVVMTLPSGDMVVLNESAATIAGLLSRNACDARDIASALEEAYGADCGASLNDVRRTLAKLRSAGAIEPARPHGGASGRLPGSDPVSRRAFVAGALVAGAGLFLTPRAFGAEAADRATSSYGAELVPIEEAGSKRMVVDSLGRKVPLPPKIERVAGFGPLALAMLEGIDFSMIAHVSARGLHALPGRNVDLAANLSMLSGGEGLLDTYALEEEAPDLVLDIATSVGRVSAQAEEAAALASVPILHLVVSEGELAQAYRSLERILDRPRAFELADMAARIQTTLAQGREEARAIGERAVYFGTGACGLSTRSKGTLLDVVVSSVGARNVASGISDKDCEEISVSRIMEWEPDVAVVAPTQDPNESLQDEIVRKLWARLAEIGSFDLRHAPTLEFDWALSSPLALMTFGALWLAKAVYPEVYDYDVKAVANDCIDAFFGRTTAASNAEPNVEALQSSGDDTSKVDLVVGSVAEDGYTRPLVEVISADILNSTRSYMSSGGGSGGGGGGGVTPTPITYTNACLLFSGIRIPGINALIPIDHSALFVGRSDGSGYFFSFAGDPSAGVGVVEGTDGFLSTAVSHNGNAEGYPLLKPKMMTTYGSITQLGKVFTDFIDVRDGAYDIGYYRRIRIPINNVIGSALVGYAQSYRTECAQRVDDSLAGYGNYSGITTCFSLLYHNCYNAASDLLGLLGIEIDYSNAEAYAVLAAACTLLTAYNVSWGAALAAHVAALSVNGDFPDIPNCVFDGLVQVTRNGSTVCSASDPGVKHEFRGRSDG